MKNIAIITARGGSKRIPRKNIKDFEGRPMISYAIEAALKSQIFDDVMVSTEDSEIAEVAKRYGASVPFMRSEKTADDFATTFDVLDEVVTEYKKRGVEIGEFCCIYPCVPFLTPEVLKDAYEVFKGHDALCPVCKFSVPIEHSYKIENGLLVHQNPKAMKMRTQDLEPKYFDVGMFYFCKTEKMYENNSLAPKDTVPYIIDESLCRDIDNPEDWKIAEMQYRILKQNV